MEGYKSLYPQSHQAGRVSWNPGRVAGPGADRVSWLVASVSFLFLQVSPNSFLLSLLKSPLQSFPLFGFPFGHSNAAAPPLSHSWIGTTTAQSSRSVSRRPSPANRSISITFLSLFDPRPLLFSPSPSIFLSLFLSSSPFVIWIWYLLVILVLSLQEMKGFGVNGFRVVWWGGEGWCVSDGCSGMRLMVVVECG